MKTAIPPVPLAVAHVLLGKMAQAARNAGDVGCEFLTSGVFRLISHEIETRRAYAREADSIAAELQTAAGLVEAYSAAGKIDASGLIRLRAALRKPERHAGHLAARLAMPEGRS